MASPWRPLVSLLAPSPRLILAARPPAAHPAPLARTLTTAARYNAHALPRRTTPRSIDAARGFSSSLRTEAKAVAGLGKRLTDSPVALLRRRVVLASRSLSTATAIPLHADSASPSASTTYPDPPEEPLTTPGVSRYLFGVAALVFAIVIVGGMTRLTESGLSITEWNVIKGVQLPLSSAEWNEEFEKYKLTPEFRINNSHMTVDDFKKIYMWEWGHRILGRIIGLTFLAPIPYFLYTRKLGRGVPLALLGIATLIGGQGALGWYMVKSGLDEESVKDLGGVPRVSQYRLAAHLGMAFLVYASCLRLGLGVGRDWKLAKKAQGLAGNKSVQETLAVLQGKVAGRTRALLTVVSALVFTTALSGAFVAGLDAGLIYNEWPTMGGSLHPPASELNKDFYCRKADKSDRWRNLFENPATAQFDHRMLAYTTFLSVVTLFAYARRPHIRAQLPPTTYRLIKASLHMSVLQVALGISTLLYLVPTHLAATHQAGSLVLLSLVLAAGASLRRPTSRVVNEAMRTLRMRDKAAQIKV